MIWKEIKFDTFNDYVVWVLQAGEIMHMELSRERVRLQISRRRSNPMAEGRKRCNSVRPQERDKEWKELGEMGRSYWISNNIKRYCV